jgi:hypothetical protein
MGCAHGSEGLIFPEKPAKSIANIKTYNLLKSNAKLADIVSENVVLSTDPPT